MADRLRFGAFIAPDVAPAITDTVALDGVADAFAALADPDQHGRILVTPQESH
jgi:hypothetical protein